MKPTQRIKYRVTLATLLAATVASQAAQVEVVRHLSSTQAVKQAIVKPQPEYPAIAKQLRLEGVVEVEATIREDGTVTAVRILNGNAVLTNSAAAASRKWKFQPVTEDGKPVKAMATISFNFKL